LQNKLKRLDGKASIFNINSLAVHKTVLQILLT